MNHKSPRFFFLSAWTACALLLALLSGCKAVDLFQFHEKSFVPNSLVLNPRLPGNCPPPEGIRLTFKESSPYLTWKANPYADFYRVYRKGPADSDFVLIPSAKKLLALEFWDTEAVKGVHSGLWSYCVVCVDSFSLPGFRSNPKSLLFPSAEIPEKCSRVSASQGFCTENKLAVKVTVALPDSMDPSAFSYLILRQEEGDSSLEVIHDSFLSASRSFSLLDVPPQTGVRYTYRVVCKNASGQVGEAVASEAPGYVFPIPKLLSVNPHEKDADGNPSGRFLLSLALQSDPLFKGIKIYATDKAVNPFKPYQDHETTLFKPALSASEAEQTLALESAKLLTLMNQTYFGKFIFCLAAVYENQTGEGASEIETAYSNSLSSFVYSKEGADFEFPQITVQNGTATRPIKLSWPQKPHSPVSEYKIYRVQQLKYYPENDVTEWGEAVDTVDVSGSAGQTVQWEDEATASLPFGPYIYKVNPCIGTEENQNDATVDSFAYACKGFDPLTVSSQSQAHLDKIEYTWTSYGSAFVSTYFGYQIEIKAPGAAAWPQTPVQSFWRPATENGESVVYAHSTTILGPFSMRATPMVRFFNNGNPFKTLPVAAVSNEVVSGIRLTDAQWAKAFWTEWLQAQSLILPADRQRSSFSDGGIHLHADKTKGGVERGSVDFKRRSYASNCDNEKYDVFHLVNYQTDNDAFTINGTLYHLYFNDNTSLKKYKPLIYVSFSSSVFSMEHSSADDKLPKTQGEITVTGFYPATVQLWFKNDGYEARNNPLGNQMTDDYPDSQIYVPDNQEKLKWFSDSYGLKVNQNDDPKIHHAHALSVKRNGGDWVHLSASSVRNGG